MITVVPPSIVLSRSTQISGGYLFEARDGQEIGLAVEGGEHPVTDLPIPRLGFLDVDIYILPHTYRQRVNGRWTENKMAARGQANWIAVGPREPGIDYRYLMWHEMGHVFHFQRLNFDMVRMSPEFREYMQLRGIEGWRFGEGAPHNQRAEEIFADDFAHLFAGVPLSDLPYLQRLGAPSNAVRDYIWSMFPSVWGDTPPGKEKIKVEAFIGSMTAVRNGHAVPLHVAPKLENGRTVAGMRDMAELFGFTVGWDPGQQKITAEN
jgi:hypothetical protein